jgi:type II secretory pathway pseudopilin PulG
VSRRVRQRGMSLVIAIFLITVIATLAAFAVTVGTATRESENLQLQADRAMAAARAGMEWAAYRMRVAGVCPQGTFPLAQGALRGFQVTITRLSDTGPHEAPLNYRICSVRSFAQWGRFGAANYASRSVEQTFISAPF